MNLNTEVRLTKIWLLALAVNPYLPTEFGIFNFYVIIFQFEEIFTFVHFPPVFFFLLRFKIGTPFLNKQVLSFACYFPFIFATFFSAYIGTNIISTLTYFSVYIKHKYVYIIPSSHTSTIWIPCLLTLLKSILKMSMHINIWTHLQEWIHPTETFYDLILYILNSTRH